MSPESTIELAVRETSPSSEPPASEMEPDAADIVRLPSSNPTVPVWPSGLSDEEIEACGTITVMPCVTANASCLQPEMSSTKASQETATAFGFPDDPEVNRTVVMSGCFSTRLLRIFGLDCLSGSHQDFISGIRHVLFYMQFLKLVEVIEEKTTCSASATQLMPDALDRTSLNILAT